MGQKLITVQEYATKENIKLAAAYKRLKTDKYKKIVVNKFGRLLIKDTAV